jgi:hypothetical protein
MIDQPQQEKEEQLREKGKQCCDKLEEEERTRLQAKNGRIEGEAAPTNKHKASLKINSNKADGSVNSDRQSKPSDPSNTRTSEHEGIALLFRMATDKLDQVETNAKKEKQQIVRDLARDLEKFRPIDRIASEIVEELREKVSKSVIYAALDDRYKTSYRVQNARKRKKEKEKKDDSLAPTSELKQVIIDTSGHSTQQLVSEPDSSHDGDNNKPQQQGITQNSKSVTINEVGSGISTDASPPQPSDKYIGQECPGCLELQDEVIQLREALKHTSMRAADEIPASEFELIIPKEEYEMVKDAMDKSNSAIFVKCDGSKKFVRALADVDN